ncbi:MAG: RHS repeat-associated core domain-containing protein [Thermoanaerobaculia bacterium]
MLYSLTRDNAPNEILYFSFAGRPVAQLTIDGDNETYEWITTDHLGTPIALSNNTGAVLWQGGFEPYGKDYAGAAAQNLFLRLPGQWEEETWSEAGLGVGAFYNVHRWYESGAGRYGEVDPARVPSARPAFLYVAGNPSAARDPLGLFSLKENCGPICSRVPTFSECERNPSAMCALRAINGIRRRIMQKPCRQALINNGVVPEDFEDRLRVSSPYPGITCDQAFCTGPRPHYYRAFRLIPFCPGYFVISWEGVEQSLMHEFLHDLGVQDDSTEQQSILTTCYPGYEP